MADGDQTTKNRNVRIGGDASGTTIHTGDEIILPPLPVVNPFHQLPAPPRDFTGRAEELEDLKANFHRGVAISGLHGIGGVGKTALALKLAEYLKPRYPDAQFYLDLRGVSANPLSAAGAMAHVIRAYHPLAKLPDGEDELSAIYRSLLHEKRALLVMDNVKDGQQVAPLAPPAGCALIVTSRVHIDPLYLPGLYPRDINRMTADDARDLLIRIASRISEQADEIARLCGHLPLALRVAASAVAVRKTMTPAEYVEKLKDEKHRLSHLREVDVALSVSYTMIGEEKQKLWRALAVFPATFDHAAASAVWGMELETAKDKLGDLFVYSLVEYDEETRRYSRHDLARLYADERLSEEENFEYRRRHSAHYQEIIKRADQLYLKGGKSIKEGLTLFDMELINAEAGHKWAVANAEDERALELCDDYPAKCYNILPLRQHPRQRIVWLETALKAARRLGRKQAEGWHIGNLGNAYADLGETRKAIEFYEQALVIDREIGDRRGESIALWNMSLSLDKLGERARAIECAEAALKIREEIEDPRAEKVREQLDEWRQAEE